VPNQQPHKGVIRLSDNWHPTYRFAQLLVLSISQSIMTHFIHMGAADALCRPYGQQHCLDEQHKPPRFAQIHVSCVQVRGACCSPSPLPTSSQRHGQARWWTGTAGSVCWPLWAAPLSGSRPPIRACTSSLLPSSSPSCRLAGLPSPSLRGASTLMSSRYTHALAAPAVADACFAMGIASSETCICLDDSHGNMLPFCLLTASKSAQ